MTTDTNNAATPALTPEQRAEIKGERTAAVRAQHQHELNLAYGPHPRQILDIYHPVQTGPAPVLVFIHGGGWRAGAPGAEGYLGGPLLNRGVMFIPMGYRLIPDGGAYPHSCDDVEHGLRWLTDHIAEHGGDPDRIYLSGTSAGATLAAAVTLDAWLAEPALPNDLIKGLVLFSGRFDRNDADVAAPSDDPGSPRYRRRLSQSIVRTPPQTILVNTTDESAFPDVPDQNATLMAALQSRGASVERLIQPQADHFTSPRSLADGSGAVFDAVIGMMKLG